MILIIGGAYQGKLEFAKERFALNASDILKNGIVDVGKSTICNLIKKRYTPSR